MGERILEIVENRFDKRGTRRAADIDRDGHAHQNPGFAHGL
ncbi:hypothetical protein AAAK29_25890 [Mesorhizobium sp. CCNWLW179-1]